MIRTFLRAHLLAIAICASLLLLYTLAGFLLVPRIARSQLEQFVTQTLQQHIAIEELRFNPFTFEASAHNVRVSESSGRELVGFRHLYVDAQLASLWQRAVVLREVELSAPSVQLVVERDGSVNLTALRPPTAENTTSTDESTPIRIGAFALREGRIGIEDHSRARPFAATLAPIRFALTDFKTDVGHSNGYQFSAASESGERLDWNGAFTVRPLGSTGDFRIGGLHLKTLESYLETALPFQVTSGDADLAGNYRFDLEPLVLNVTLPTVSIRELALAERGATENPIKAAAIDLQQIAFSLERREVRVGSIGIRGAHLDVARENDGAVSLRRLFAGEATPQSTAAPSDTAQPWRAAIDEVRLEGATIIAEDRTVQPAVRFDLSSLNASVAGWNTDPDATVKVALEMGINAGGKLRTSGDVRLEPLHATVNLDLAQFDLTALQPYVASTAHLTVHSGALDVKGDVRFSAAAADANDLQFTGNVRVAGFRTTDQALDQDFVTWRDLSIAGIDYKSRPASLTIERITTVQPYANVIIAADGTTNVSRVLSKESATPAEAAPASTPSQPMAMAVKLVQIERGSANFADRSIEPSFAARIVGLQGKVTGLSSRPASRAKVALTGKVDEYAPVDITGEVNLLAAAKYSDLAMNFRNMELTTFNPYSGKFAGYNISKGKLSTELKYRIEDRRLQADHHIIVDNLEFGDKTDSKDAAPIPIKLGVALLKDRNGVIDVSLPVTGTLDDPQFRLGPIIWKAVLGLLTKIVTAPFSALGALFGGGDELAFVDFATGSGELTASESEKLSQLAKALVERPALRLDVPITSLPNDRDSLARAALAARVPADAAIDVYEKAYRALTTQPPAYPEELKAKEVPVEAKRAWLETEMLAKLQPDASALNALARERARVVQAALLANPEVQPERIFITTERTASATPEGKVRMELKLE